MARGHIYRQHNSATILREQRQYQEQKRYHEERKSDTLLNELSTRLGIERYTEFVSQYGGAADFREKAAAMLDTLDWRDQHQDEIGDPLHDWTNNPQHIKTNGVY